MNKAKLSVLKAIRLSLLILATLIVFISGGEARVSRKQDNADESIHAGPTVEQVDKNIKVLNGMPESQLIPAMKFMSASLGVSCDYCHVSKNGQLDAAADDKEKKRTARAMIKMVLQANATTFHGNPQVSCYTCHRGQAVPQAFPTLPVPPKSSIAAGAGAPAPSASATATLPSADEVLDKYTRVIGGQPAIDKIKSCVVSGTIANASGSTGTFESAQIVADKGHEVVTTQRGTRVRVLNQRHGWEKNAFGVNALSGQQLQDVKLSLPLFGNLKLKDGFSRFEISGQEKIDNHDVYVVSAIRPDQKRERLYFDLESGLLLRRVSDTRTTIGVIPEQTDLGEYRDVEGMKLPTTIRISSVDSQNPTSTRKVDKVELNIPIEESRFNKPD